ncbi:unnamed protein product [Brassica rapa subsp. narinosa]
MISFHISTFERILYLLDLSSISYLFPSRKGFYKQTTKKGISRSKPSSRKAPPKHAAIQVSDATQQEMLISHGFLDFNAGRCRLACVLTNAGEAIHGWFQFRSDAFGKLIKVYHIHSFKHNSL